MLQIITSKREEEDLGEISLDEIARRGAEKMLAAALKAEADHYVERLSGERDEKGHALVVKNGSARPRKVTVGSGVLDVIAPRVDEALKEVTKAHTAQEIVQKRSQVKERTLSAAREKIGTMLEVVDVVIEDISLSSKLEAAIERKMVQEQEANKAVFQQQKAQIEADTAIIQARGEAEAIQIRGDALSKNAAFIDLEIVERWNGATPRVVGGGMGGADMLLPLGSLKTSGQASEPSTGK